MKLFFGCSLIASLHGQSQRLTIRNVTGACTAWYSTGTYDVGAVNRFIDEAISRSETCKVEGQFRITETTQKPLCTADHNGNRQLFYTINKVEFRKGHMFDISGEVSLKLMSYNPEVQQCQWEMRAGTRTCEAIGPPYNPYVSHWKVRPRNNPYTNRFVRSAHVTADTEGLIEQVLKHAILSIFNEGGSDVTCGSPDYLEFLAKGSFVAEHVPEAPGLAT